MNTGIQSRTTLLLTVLAAGLASGGCSSVRHEVKVDAVTRPASTSRGIASYQIHSRNPHLDDKSLRYKEAAQHVKTALSGHGLYEAQDHESADVVVEIDYGVTRGQIKYERVMMPIYGNPAALQGGHGGAPVAHPTATPGMASAASPGHIRQPGADRTQIIGYKEVAVPVDTCEKYLSFTARENQAPVEGRPAPEIWRIQASIEDQGTDIRGALPVLAAAVMEHIGHDSRGQTTITVQENDPAIAFIRRGL